MDGKPGDEARRGQDRVILFFAAITDRAAVNILAHAMAIHGLRSPARSLPRPLTDTHSGRQDAP